MLIFLDLLYIYQVKIYFDKNLFYFDFSFLFSINILIPLKLLFLFVIFLFSLELLIFDSIIKEFDCILNLNFLAGLILDLIEKFKF
jgi:hypothetical protein